MSPPRLHVARRGFTMLELMITMILLGAVIVTVTPLLRWAAVQYREADRRGVALQEIQNVLERLSARSYESLTPETVNGIEISGSTRSRLREPRLKITLEASEEPQAKQIVVELHWKDAVGNEVTPVRLTTWVFPLSAGEE